MVKSSSFWEQSETGNWNVASDFSKLKIMKLLYESDEYETIATFGTLDIVDEFMIDNNTKTLSRIRAIKRLVKTLQMVINNTKFAVKKNDKKKMVDFLKDLKKIEEILPFLEESSHNQRLNRTTINIKEEEFLKILNTIINIKSSILEPLNKADLIFSGKEDFDPAKAKELIKKGVMETG